MNDLLNLSPEEWTTVHLSLRVATVAMLASLPVGIAIAYLLQPITMRAELNGCRPPALGRGDNRAG